MKNWSKRFTHQIISCQRCQKKLRLPIRPGKTLRVDCAGCGLVFDISFEKQQRLIFIVGFVVAALLLIALILAQGTMRGLPDFKNQSSEIVEII